MENKHNMPVKTIKTTLLPAILFKKMPTANNAWPIINSISIFFQLSDKCITL